jgi:pimeloyl-ACP methyl ester carboxylesterase
MSSTASASATHREELVSTSAEDGIALEGVVFAPAGASTAAPHDLAVVWVHGLTGRFYGATQVRAGRHLASLGFTVVSGNNRGHDFGYVLRRTPQGQVALGGGGWELFSESPRDVASWVSYAEQLGQRGVVLVGHSLGALKVGYYQALRQDPRVRAVVAVSPPAGACRIDPDLRAQAERMVAEGRGQDLLPWGIFLAGGGTQSAQTYLDRAHSSLDVYGFHTPHPVAARIACPLFACYGSDEAWVGGAAELEAIRRGATGAVRVETRMVEGADHSYAGHEIELADHIAACATSLAAHR